MRRCGGGLSRPAVSHARIRVQVAAAHADGFFQNATIKCMWFINSSELSQFVTIFIQKKRLLEKPAFVQNGKVMTTSIAAVLLGRVFSACRTSSLAASRKPSHKPSASHPRHGETPRNRQEASTGLLGPHQWSPPDTSRAARGGKWWSQVYQDDLITICNKIII